MAEQLTWHGVQRPVKVVDRQDDPVVAVGPQECDVPGDGQQQRELDRVTGRDLYAAERVGRAVNRSPRGTRLDASGGAGLAPALILAARGGDERERGGYREKREVPALPHLSPLRSVD